MHCQTLTMTASLAALPIVMAAATVTIVARARSRLTGTTLHTSWSWALAASLMALAAAIFDACRFPSHNWRALVWYLTALLALCPPIAVLGARRPGARVWNWFVLLPLVAVLGWPAATVFGADGQPGALQLEAPPLVGCFLVLVMGTGNYLGTRFGLAASLYFLAVALLVLPFSTAASNWTATPAELRQFALAFWGAAALAAARAARPPADAPTGVDRLWHDFRHTFGIVWSHRIQERVNAEAARERWPAHLTPAGFNWRPDATAADRARTEPRIEHTLRWLLRRFVDEAWIDARLGASANPRAQ